MALSLCERRMLDQYWLKIGFAQIISWLNARYHDFLANITNGYLSRKLGFASAPSERMQ